MPAVPQVLWTNTAQGTVSTGAADVPAQNTSESITVSAATAAAFPTATNTAVAPAVNTTFYFADVLAPSETFACTVTSGTTWTVTRGADGTIPVQHSVPFTIRGVTPAGVLASFQAFLTGALPAYYKSVSVTPSATINTYGTPFSFAPPSPYRFLLPLHIFIQATTIGSETLTVLGSGSLEDGTSGGSATTLINTSGVIDAGNLMAGFMGLAGNNAGQTVTGAKRLASYSIQVKSSIASSTAAVTCALWTALIP